MLVKIEGIVIRARSFGESNQVVQVYSEHLGKLSFVARGAKKTRSRFSALTQPFTIANFLCFSSGNGLPTLNQADLVHSHQAIRQDLLRTSYGAYWLDLVDHLFEEKEPNPGLYRFLKTAFDWLEQEKDPDILTRMVECKMMAAGGYRPILHACAQCGSEERRPVTFSIYQGGFLCETCKHTDSHAIPLSDATIRILPVLVNLPIDRLGEITIKEETKQQLERVIRSFLMEHVDIRLKSWDILEQMRKVWAASDDSTST
ncbi:DNA repair protein RecO [Baia soyae]|uniref:DNA repair protein RecO n=1 Tax=Baia soyae TaxID=1544746 RepID=A0A4R2RPG3_9BACL|nr:DNA repair protein RecO [Baia soyae]TCP65113.1 DNA replication and repair protein RecO [Baia soyae]